MKAVVADCCVRSHPGLHRNCYRVAGKTSNRCDVDSKEMRACFSKLQELVPVSKKQDGHVDKTELLQSVIDYIYQLEDTLAFSGSSLCDVLDSSLSRRSPHSELSSVSSKSPNMEVSEDSLLSTEETSTQLDSVEVRPPSQ